MSLGLGTGFHSIKGAWSQVISSGTSQQSIGELTGNAWVAGSFTAANSGSVTSLTIWMIEVGNCTGKTYTVYLYSNSSGEPGSALTNGTITGNDSSALLGSASGILHTFSTPPSITSGTKYFIVIKADDAVDAVNYIRVVFASGTAEPANELVSDADGVGPWTVLNADADIRATVIGT